MNCMERKVAVVTGGALGIGRATSELLAREGAKVAILDLLDEKGSELAAAIGREGGIARYWHADVARESDIARVIPEIAEAFGRIDVLVNNAGISGANKPTHELTERSGTGFRR